MNRSPFFMSLNYTFLSLFSNKDFVDWIFLTNFVRKLDVSRF